MKLSQPSLFGEGEDRGGCSPPCALCWVWRGEGALAVHGVHMGCKLPDAPSFSLLPNIFFFTLFQGQSCMVERVLLTSSSPGG